MSSFHCFFDSTKHFNFSNLNDLTQGVRVLTPSWCVAQSRGPSKPPSISVAPENVDIPKGDTFVYNASDPGSDPLG